MLVRVIFLTALMTLCGVGCLYLLMLALRPEYGPSYVVAALPLGIVCLILLSAVSKN